MYYTKQPLSTMIVLHAAAAFAVAVSPNIKDNQTNLLNPTTAYR